MLRSMLCLALVLLSTAAPVQAAEIIRSFHSAIDIAVDGELTVTETITVQSEGKQIKRGIYRDFPTLYRDRYGNRHRVLFDVVDVTRGGIEEPWHTRRRSNGVRIYAGDSDTLLPPGTYTYTFAYRTNRQIGFFDAHDELYWNVTGNGWVFPIEYAQASITLPAPVAQSAIEVSGYTGPTGARGKAYRAFAGTGGATIETTDRLAAREGLTVSVIWPKGVLEEPGALQNLLYQLKDNFGLFGSALALVASFFYLLLTWLRVGRDPPPGVIFPHYEPPEGYSPASARYINRMGYDIRTFTSAVVNLAVKGHLSIDHAGKQYTLKRLPSKQELAPGEAAMLDELFRSGAVLILKDSNHADISAARAAHKNALADDYRNRYFKTNVALLWPSILGSALLLFIVLVSASFVPLSLVFFLGVVLLHVVFVYLMKVPLTRGRRLMDKLEGFRLYLEVAEKDDLNLKHPPEMTPELFERYLPFAIALGVEQAWAEQFVAVFAALEANTGTASYHPHWYHGDFRANSMADFSSDVGKGLSSSISSAASPPGSGSGGGGGGFSGGGGGGGGGGGW